MMDRKFLAVSIGVEELTRLILLVAPELSSLSPEVTGVYAYADQDTQEVIVVIEHPSFHRHTIGHAIMRHRITAEDIGKVIHDRGD